MNVTVIKPGLLTTLQDTGRAGFAHLGIGRSGAFDTPAARIANALCGNPPDACVLEVTLLGPTLRFAGGAWIAVTGAPLALHVNGGERAMWAPLRVPPGSSVTLGRVCRGCRSYLAVQGGGFQTTPVLGSRSTDVNAHLGAFDGRPLRAGDVLPVAGPRGNVPAASRGTPGWKLDPRPWFVDDATRPLRIMPGEHFERLSTAACNTLLHMHFKVHADSNRTGLHLDGPRLEFAGPIEMISEGCIPGLIQLPPSGQPIVFGPECPVSGGYPRIAQVIQVDLPRLAQLRPGDGVSFVRCTLAEARTVLERREQALRTLEAAIRIRLMQAGRPEATM